jgi:hypothetical protein
MEIVSTKQSVPTCRRHEHELVRDAVRVGIFCGPEVGQPAARLGPAGGHRPPLAAEHEPGSRARVVMRWHVRAVGLHVALK